MKRALVIEDEFAALRMLSVVLEAHGFEVHEAGEGASALAKLGTTKYDLVLCDGRMPIMSGPALLAAMRSVPSLADVPFVLMLEPYEKRPNLGVPVLVKPIRLQALRDAIELATRTR